MIIFLYWMQLATNWKTAIPLSLGFAIPLFAYDVSTCPTIATSCLSLFVRRILMVQIIVMDSHMELAAIFWSSVAMVQMNFGSTIRNSIQEENDEIKQ